jgi:hypothetical protein
MFVVGFCLMWLKWHDIDHSMTAQFDVTAAVGTFATCRRTVTMSLHRGGAGVVGARPSRRE